MKCIKFKTATLQHPKETILRVTDEDARWYVDEGQAEYVPKSEWKKARQLVSL